MTLLSHLLQRSTHEHYQVVLHILYTTISRVIEHSNILREKTCAFWKQIIDCFLTKVIRLIF